ncbi:unnamed protein product [Protopolystoma xenopodis]|uniref:Secreted protein n=1 Tax=Protopolystoma xenopodis TaxID=117903 RepID=A0A448WE86_9PLAT|nr:unnamed protein product [Protopolystoma xenopodis]
MWAQALCAFLISVSEGEVTGDMLDNGRYQPTHTHTGLSSQYPRLRLEHQPERREECAFHDSKGKREAVHCHTSSCDLSRTQGPKESDKMWVGMTERILESCVRSLGRGRFPCTGMCMGMGMA